jgi:hypothetical protein
MSGDETDADRFRRQAMICWEEAAKACGPEDAASWHRLAEDLLRVGEDFDERAQLRHRAIEPDSQKGKPS